ncbi:MAG TPA: FtsW/RodA/SpoVE family cell cycle protein [Anaerolineaceae bacterium]|nr:FtsW/RodA/SpoVE family cell cycle protein [Anaerolineaceae bacterium]HPN51474.1 FtsW/RodA/SpoVE family cell cycle protein [Anaerolineaceae bacterium]
MGEGTFVTPEHKSSVQRALRLRLDVPLLLIVITLLVFGLLMVFSSSPDYSNRMFGEPYQMFQRQVLWAVVGVVVATVLSVIDYHLIRRFLVPMMGGTILLLLAVLLTGNESLGSIRSFLGGSVRPSELAKLVTVIYLAFWLFARKDELNQISIGLVPMGAILGITGGLILAQPDFSAAGTIILLGILLFFLAGGDWRQIVLVTLGAVLMGWLVAQVWVYVGDRLESYLATLENPLKSSPHVQRAMEAVVRGGFFGVGLGQATTKFTGLPLPPNDSIFAVVAEETGLLGMTLVMALFGGFFWRGWVIASRAKDQLGSLLAIGLTGWITMEAIFNMAMIVGIFPVAGNSLPFFSAGGSSLVMTMAAVGIIMNVARSGMEGTVDEGRPFSAVVDLWRRNGGRRVSRTRRVERTQD